MTKPRRAHKKAALANVKLECSHTLIFRVPYPTACERLYCPRCAAYRRVASVVVEV